MGKVSFSVSARTAKLIGQENFATAEGAIIELVKNSYDADAKNCVIIFENDGKYVQDPSIYIIDNGIGMTKEVIINQWMKIGTDEKLQNFTTDEGRVKTGAKGIGRFALDRLGLYSEMYTVAKNTGEGSIWSVNWSDFDQLGIAISEVDAELNGIENPDLKQIILDQFKSSKVVNEHIESVDFKSGTILKINPLRDRWDEEAIKSLFNNLEVLIPPQEQPVFDVHLFSKVSPDEFGRVSTAYYDDYDYKVFAKYLADENHTVEIIITRNEFDINALKTDYLEVFESNLLKEFPYDLDTFEKKTFTIKRTIDDFSFGKSIDKELLKEVGKFEFTFYFLKNQSEDKGKFPYKNFTPANRRAWLKKFGGVKVFRDDFRVRPYGEDGQDWLKLGDRLARSRGGPGQKLGGYRIGPNQISGTVRISRIANASFQDKSGREGIQENEVFDLFKNILIEIISVFERDRNVIMFALSELAKTRFKNEQEKAAAKELADRILKETAEAEDKKSVKNANFEQGANGSESKVGSTNENTPNEVLLATANNILEQEIEDKNEEIRMLRGLASVGLIVTSFAHELKGLRSRLAPRTDFLIKELKKYISEKSLEGVNRDDNPFYMVDLIKEEDVKLKHWLDYSLSTLKRDKRTRTDINIGEYFEKFEANWRMALQQRKVTMTLIGNKYATNIIRAFEVDLDAVFNNLLSNSLAAFKEKKGSYAKEVSVKWQIEGDYIEVLFSDNGCGLDQVYKNEPYKIFEFNESSKTDRLGNKIGTGMGLYIVQLVIDDYSGAEVQIAAVNEGFGLLTKFPLRKNQNA